MHGGATHDAMFEGRFILPLTDNDGNDLSPVHKRIRKMLASEFGGYTATRIEGGWINGDDELIEESGIAYDVALVGGHETALWSIAVQGAAEADQEAVYIRYPSGAVVIEDAPDKTKALEAHTKKVLAENGLDKPGVM